MLKKIIIGGLIAGAFACGVLLSQWIDERQVTTQNNAWQHSFDSNIPQKSTLNEIESRFIVIDFWSSWCKPCVKSLPYYLDFFKQIDAKDITFLTINLDSDKQQALDFMIKYQLEDLNTFFDPEGHSQKFFSISGLPSLLIYDQQQTLLHTKLGFKEKDKIEFEVLIKSLLATPIKPNDYNRS